MNQKKAKLLRKALKRNGLDINQRIYNDSPARARVGADGTRFAVTGTISLSPTCGRAVYQRMKTV